METKFIKILDAIYNFLVEKFLIWNDIFPRYCFKLMDFQFEI
jgi:hypothetical protein